MRGSAPACLAKTNTVARAKAPRLDFCAGHVMGHIIGQRVRCGRCDRRPSSSDIVRRRIRMRSPTRFEYERARVQSSIRAARVRDDVPELQRGLGELTLLSTSYYGRLVHPRTLHTTRAASHGPNAPARLRLLPRRTSGTTPDRCKLTSATRTSSTTCGAAPTRFKDFWRD
jgi:hypothetical protein